MNLTDLGYDNKLEIYRNDNKLDALGVGRVVSVHKERYVVKTHTMEYDAEILGNLRYSAQSRADFPVVGDWVALSVYDENKALIHAVLPRKSLVERQAVGKKGEKQIIAANIDFAFIVQAVGRDFSLNRIERYLTICYAANIQPIIVLNKTDLVDAGEKDNLINMIQKRVKGVPVFAISNHSLNGIEALHNSLLSGKTYCLLGSSGVGKSTLLNTLAGGEVMKTNTINETINRGRHVTTHRELHILENGSLFIDNPGMREVGIADVGHGLEITFDAISELSKECRYNDCTHTAEDGCAVLEAVENGTIDLLVFENYQKMKREQIHYESTIAERRQKDKDFGKMIKKFKKIKGHE
ncbi:MAG: ribosome small subunit-dependent GTPase A [Prolixibacteraceae bacterium]|nr:ribosome small subunit-dependent GTPase A [Prolixibacteraceae bacterium]MBN2650391.1 ribosome small subunit-dependent GTPase A [Prolixibacteraceae bacterium]